MYHYTTRAGQTISNGYDDLDRLISRTGPGLAETLTYDGVGRIVDASHPDGLVHHTYDGLGRVSAVTWPGGLTVGYEYDGASNLTGLTYPDGSKVTYVYDQMNRLTQILDDAVPANVLAAYQYDQYSRRTLLTLNNGVTSASTYTLDNEVLNLAHTWTGGEATYIYGFDGNGRRTNLRISNDAFDPWLTVTPSLALTANNLNQITSMGGTTVTYDLNGNLAGDGTHAYTHDAINRLTSVDGTISYTYDALGRRVSKTVSATTTKYVYDGAQVIAEYDGAGQLLRKYVYGPGLDEPVMMQVGAARYYYLFDSLGSVIGLTDASGNLVESYRYNAYGQPLQASTVGNPYLFTGGRFDSETGLYYYRNRYYSPQLRRFIEPDPIGFEGGMNLYAYVGNDPANVIDPWGLQAIPFPIPLPPAPGCPTSTQMTPELWGQMQRDISQFFTPWSLLLLENFNQTVPNAVAFAQGKGERDWGKRRGDDPLWDKTIKELKEIEKKSPDPKERERAKKVRKMKEKSRRKPTNQRGPASSLRKRWRRHFITNGYIIMDKHRFLSSKLNALIENAAEASKSGGFEICGLLIDNGYFLELKQCVNKSRKGGAFAFYQREVSRIQRAAEVLNHEIVGTFHSHPFATAEPGASDLANAFDDELMLIIDVTDKDVVLWHIKGNRKIRVLFELI